MSFILGTANLLSNYGINGITSALNESEAVRIFNEAQAYGVGRLDSAESYPKVEEFLGSTISNLQSYKVDSKIKIKSKFTEKEFMNHVDMILSDLKLKKLNTLYLHNMESLSDSNLELTTNCLYRVLNEGKADHVGVSVYTEHEIEFSLKQFPKFESFQILENICDRRTLNSNYLSNLYDSGIELNIRSIFLQGLLLCNLASIPKHLSGTRKSLEEFQSFADKINYTRFELCVAYAKQVPWASNIVIGVGTMSELIKIVSVDKPLPKEYKNYNFEIPTEFKDPRNWVL